MINLIAQRASDTSMTEETKQSVIASQGAWFVQDSLS